MRKSILLTAIGGSFAIAAVGPAAAKDTNAKDRPRMRTKVSYLLKSIALVSGLALGCGSASALHVYNVPESTVVRACGGHQTGTANGQFGCSRCDGGVCRDYNCSNGSHGVKQGCRETVIDKKSPVRKPNGPRNVTGVNSVGTINFGGAKAGHPAKFGGANQTGHRK